MIPLLKLTNQQEMALQILTTQIVRFVLRNQDRIRINQTYFETSSKCSRFFYALIFTIFSTDQSTAIILVNILCILDNINPNRHSFFSSRMTTTTLNTVIMKVKDSLHELIQ